MDQTQNAPDCGFACRTFDLSSRRAKGGRAAPRYNRHVRTWRRESVLPKRGSVLLGAPSSAWLLRHSRTLPELRKPSPDLRRRECKRRIGGRVAAKLYEPPTLAPPCSRE